MKILGLVNQKKKQKKKNERLVHKQYSVRESYNNSEL